MAREGYVNLLPANRKRSKEPGDNREMVDARRRVHQAQLYRPLAHKIADVLQAYTNEDQCNVLDLGCGEGYYSGALLKQWPAAIIHGVDISKPAVRLAAKAFPAAEFSVASAFNVPLADNSVDAVFSVFAPTQVNELARLLRPGGLFLDVSPGPRHLWGLRELLYDEPVPHQREFQALPPLDKVEQERVDFTLELKGGHLQDLVTMTPYAYGGQRENKGKIADSKLMTLGVSFLLSLYRLPPA
jgi:23S rRNA (guanine745-N1)-methyltransferase